MQSYQGIRGKHQASHYVKTSAKNKLEIFKTTTEESTDCMQTIGIVTVVCTNQLNTT